MTERQESHLRCSHCGTDARHEVVYVGRLVSRIRCEACGHLTELDISHDYLDDLARRIGSKPARMARGMRWEPETFTGFPRRMASKPLRMMQELIAVARSRWDRGRSRRRGEDAW